MPKKTTKEQPAAGGAVREPIKDMLAPGSEDDFKESLPEQTVSEDPSSPEETKVRKKRRSKEEMAAARGESAAPVDKRLERAKSKASGLGGAALVESGFKIAGKPLDDEEKQDVEDQFYLIAVKSGIDPSGSWLFVALYTIALLARLILSRTDLGEQLKSFLEGKSKEKENPGDSPSEAPAI
jgi:hypothetical protein